MAGLERRRAAPACARSPRRPCRRAARRAAARAARVARHIAISSWRLAPWLSVPAMRAALPVEAGGGERARARPRCCAASPAARCQIAQGRGVARLRREAAVLEHAELAERSSCAGSCGRGRRGRAAAAASASRRRRRSRRGPRTAPISPESMLIERRLAGAVGADDGVDLADVQVERHGVDRDQAAEAAREALARSSGAARASVGCGAQPWRCARAAARRRPIRPFGSSATKAMMVRPSVSCQCAASGPTSASDSIAAPSAA